MGKKITNWMALSVTLASLLGCSVGGKPLENYARAWQAYAAGDEQQALRLLAENEDRRPRLAQDARLLGRIHFLGGRLPEGERFLRLALQRDPQNVDTRKWLARLLLSQAAQAQAGAQAGTQVERAIEAIELLEPALASSAEDAELYALIARAQRAGGDVAAALASFEQARALYGRAVEVALELADLYQAVGLDARAQLELQRGLLLAEPGSALADWIETRLSANGEQR